MQGNERSGAPPLGPGANSCGTDTGCCGTAQIVKPHAAQHQLLSNPLLLKGHHFSDVSRAYRSSMQHAPEDIEVFQGLPLYALRF